MVKNGIQIKILIFLLLISMIPLSILSYIGYTDIKKLIDEREELKIKEFHKNIEGKMIKFFGSGEKDIHFLSSISNEKLKSIQTASNLNHNLDLLTSDFYYFSQTNIQYNQVRFINKEGYEVIRINNEEGSPEIVQNNQLQYKGDRYYIQEARKLKKGEIYVSSLDLNQEKGIIEKVSTPVMRFVSPLYDENTLKGFVVLNLNVKWILQDIQRVRDRTNFENVIVLDNNGFYVLHSNEKKSWGSYKDYDTGENFKKDYPKIFHDVHNSSTLKIIESNKDILSFSPIKILKKDSKKFFVVLYIDKETYLQPLIQFTSKWILEMIAIFILIIFVGVYISNHLSEPILTLTKTVEHIGKGNFDVEIDIHTGDEIECLGSEVKKMSYDLKNMYNNMEKLVKERTKELELAHAEMGKMANTDSLTGLYNRHYFNQFIQNEEQRIQNFKGILTICIIDVDKFKYINDFYGHTVGDEVLKSISEILKNSVQKKDVVIRYGGDEFLIILPDCDENDTQFFINTIYDNLKLWNESSHLLQHDLSLSIGYAEYNGTSKVLDRIKVADERMYKIKNAKKHKKR